MKLSLREPHLFIRAEAVMLYWTGANEDICTGGRKERVSQMVISRQTFTQGRFLFSFAYLTIMQDLLEGGWFTIG